MSIQVLVYFFVPAGAALMYLLYLRLSDARAERREWARLVALQPGDPPRFDPGSVADLPGPVRRYFNFAMAPGTPLRTVAEITMGGQFSLGTRDRPAYRSMFAQQILAAPSGFLWKLRLPGVVPISGSDSSYWTRFRLFGLVPVARRGGDPDHARSAFGRYVAEAVFWTPAAVLPGPGIEWQGVDEDTARVTFTQGNLSQAIDVIVAADGRPVEVRFMRWSDANPGREYRVQPFGGVLSDFRVVQGFCVPFRVEAFNHYRTPEAFCFFKADVESIRFPAA